MPNPKQVVELWVEAFNRADADGLATLYAEDATNHQVVRDPVEGREAIRGCGFFRVVDGLIRFQRGYWDRLSFQGA